MKKIVEPLDAYDQEYRGEFQADYFIESRRVVLLKEVRKEATVRTYKGEC
jgi:hypothetical protein